MKKMYWKLRLILLSLWCRVARPLVSLPRNAVIGPGVHFSKGRKIEIGERFFVGMDVIWSDRKDWQKCHVRTRSRTYRW